MAITNISQVNTNDTFQQWWTKTNDIITGLGNVVTMGSGQGNTGDIITTGHIQTDDTTDGVKTNVLSPLNTSDSLKLKYDVVEFNQKQILYVPTSGLSNTIQFVKGTDASVTANNTWAIGPVDLDSSGITEHASLQIFGRSDTGDNDAIFTFTRSTGTTPGELTGTNVVINDSILPAQISSNCTTASAFETAQTITFTGDVTGTFDVSGGAAVSTALTFNGDIPSIESITVGNGLSASGITGSTFNDTQNSGTISHTDNDVSVDTVNVSGGGSSSNSGTHGIQSLGFDRHGHINSISTKNFATEFIKKNPADAASRTKVDGFGFTVDNSTKVSFGDTNATNEAHLQRDTNTGGFSTFTIYSGQYTPVGTQTTKGRILLKALTEIDFEDHSGNTRFQFNTTNGNLSASGDITAFATLSDRSLKENIEPIENALDKVNSIGGYTFNYIDAPEKGRVPGVIAQELQEVLPEAVYETDEGKMAVRYDNTIALLVEAIKELKQQVDELKGN
jgi:hypothetical protein